MIGRYIILLVLFCVPRVYGLTTVEQRLLELEHIVKLQGEALLYQRESLEQQRELFEQQRETQEQQREELVLFKIENNKLKIQVKHLENQINEFIENQDGIIKNTKTTTEAEMQLPNNGTIDNKDRTTVLSDSDWSSRHITLKKRSSLRATSEGDVALYAYITGTPCLHDHEIIVFNTEVTDIGNGYNPTDGIYIVPMAGTYVFTWTVASRDDWYVSELVINGASIAHAFTDTGSDTNMSQATGIAVINVNQGDHVFVRKVFSRGCDVHDVQYHLTSFAAWRLFG